jgi:hypothetical protein
MTPHKSGARRDQLAQLVASTSPAASSSARKSPSATTGASSTTATAFLRSCLVDLKSTAFNAQTIKFLNGPRRITIGSEFDKSETT